MSTLLSLAAPNEEQVIDSTGRVIVYKKLTALEKTKLFKIMGDQSANPMYFVMLSTAAMTKKIGEYNTPPVFTLSFLEDVIERLGDDGINAIQGDLVTKNQTKEAFEREIKNS